VKAVLNDWRTAPVSARMLATLAFLEKLTLTPALVGPGDAKAALQAGVSEAALRQAIYVASLFATMNRMTLALDCKLPAARGLQWAVRILRMAGYGSSSVPG
jgi:alkylhydroperoxidase family enzyme